MTMIDDGGPAFPVASDVIGHHEGITLRDWFAGQALAGLCANPELVARGNFAAVADDARQFADAMLAARAKGGAQ